MKSIRILGIILFLIITVLVVIQPTVIYAEDEAYGGVGGVINPNDYDPSKNNPLQASDYDKVVKVTKTIINVLRTVGVVVSVVGLMAIGIKYMVGSVEQKAEYKKTMIPYVVGLVIIFTITQLVSLIYNITTSIKV